MDAQYFNALVDLGFTLTVEALVVFMLALAYRAHRRS
jgi:hypothetical protein